MLTPEENEDLARVGPGTPCGELLRRYWHPIAVASELTTERPKKRIKVLGEELVLYRDPNGGYGLVGEHCSHRAASLYYGFLEDGGIRCAYHGWLYDRAGRCLEQPFEPAQSMMKHAIHHPAYPVQKLAGLLFAYLGPEPAPLLPRWDVVAREDGHRKIDVHPILDCSWLQAMENSLDPVHVYYLHGHTMVTRGVWERNHYRRIEGYDFEQFEWGIVKKRTYGGDGTDQYQEPGHPAVFPNMLRHSGEGRDGSNPFDGTMPIDIHWRVPIDDTHTQIFWMGFWPSKDGSWSDPLEDDPPVTYMEPLKSPEGAFHMTSFPSQDAMAWETQGPIFDRSREHLGASDRGVAMWRELLREQIETVHRGGDPMGVVRDPEKNRLITFSPARIRVGDRLEIVGIPEGAKQDTKYRADGAPRPELSDSCRLRARARR